MLDAFGNIGDFVGGIGVIITLLYLAAQIRQNTKSSRTQSYQAAVAAISEWTREVGADAESSRIFQSGSLDFEALSESERVRFNLLMAALMRNLENIHFQYSNGAIDADTWVGWANRTASILAPAGAKVWGSSQEEAYAPAFRRFANSEMPTGKLPLSVVQR